MAKVQCISPVDGSVYAERDYLTEIDAAERIKIYSKEKFNYKLWDINI